MDENKTWNERYPTMGTGWIRRDLSWAYLLSDVRPEEKGPMSAGDYQTIIAQHTAVNVLAEDGATYLVALIAPIEAENLTLLTGYRFNVLKEHVDVHIHDAGECCECGSATHCCCDCSVYVGDTAPITRQQIKDRIWNQISDVNTIYSVAERMMDLLTDDQLKALAGLHVAAAVDPNEFDPNDPEPMAFRPSQMEA